MIVCMKNFIDHSLLGFLMLHSICHFAECQFIYINETFFPSNIVLLSIDCCEFLSYQVSEEVERALTKFGHAKLAARSVSSSCLMLMKIYIW